MPEKVDDRHLRYKSIHLRLPPVLVDELDVVCEQYGLTRTEFLKFVIIEKYKEYITSTKK